MSCPHCGNNPTSHHLTWFNESMTVLMTPLNQFFFGGAGAKWFWRVVGWVFYPFVRLLEKLNVITYHGQPSEKTSSRAEVLWEEASRRGIVMESVRIFGHENDTYRVSIGDRKLYFSGLPRPQFAPRSAEWWMDDKGLLKKKLRKAGIPIADGGAFSRFSPLKKKFEQIQKPVIIKPRLGSRGRHTTTFIYTLGELKKAFNVAKQLCYWVVMEEHLIGSVYRATMIDGKLAGILRGDPPRVTGDGVHTIRQLVEIKNANRHEKVSAVKLTPYHEVFLKRINLTLDEVLPQGKQIDLIEKIGVSYGGHSAEETHLTHPETARILEAAAEVVGDPLIGFDFIIEHIDQSPHEQKWGVIECNGVPFINLHHDPVEGYRNVAKDVWDFVERRIAHF